MAEQPEIIKIRNNKGFTLVELAIVLVIVGMLVGVGSGMMGMLTTAIKVREAKDSVEAAVQSVISWASANNRVPDVTSTPSTNPVLFTNVAATPNDSWGRPLIYLYDNALAPATTTKDTICGRRSTSLTVHSNDTGADIKNVALVLISKSDDATLQTTASDAAITVSRATSGTITLDVNNSDIVRWVTLDELRSKVGCQGAPMKIVNNELPFGAVPNSYTAKISADGGVPFSLGPSTYKWCINTLPAGFVATGGITNANCLAESEATWAAASDGLTITFPAATVTTGTYPITVVARDNADGVTTSPACNTVNPGDNCAQKMFVLTVNPN